MRNRLLRVIPLLALLCLAAVIVRADGDRCEICGSGFVGGSYYTLTDAVTGEKKMVCKTCVKCTTVCFVCGLPARSNFTELPDKRILCARDAESAILKDEDAQQICRETKDAMDRLFSRFLTIPETNVTIGIVDRVHLREMFKMPGEDYVCPNVWGYIESKTNEVHCLEHNMSLLSGLPRASFKATCVHEHGHAWLNENLSARRKKSLGKDANEGFCELLAYLLMDSQNEQAQKQVILNNAYTRGQINLFIEAEKNFGLNEVADWMKYGVDDVLSANDKQRVRNVLLPRHEVVYSPAAVAPAIESAPPPAPAQTTLALKAVIMGPHPQAVINNRSFEVNETGRVKLAGTNVTLRCLGITQDSVRIQVVDSGEEKELRLKQ